MATPKALKSKPRLRSPIPMIILMCITAIALLFLFSSMDSTNGFSFSSSKTHLRKNARQHSLHDKYLYWGDRIDCPGKHCDTCEGLGHQESSLRCALEEAIFLNRLPIAFSFLFYFHFISCLNLLVIHYTRIFPFLK